MVAGSKALACSYHVQLNPVYSSDNPSLLLSIQATLVMLFMLAQIHQLYNNLYNYLDLVYLLNYTVLCQCLTF